MGIGTRMGTKTGQICISVIVLYQYSYGVPIPILVWSQCADSIKLGTSSFVVSTNSISIFTSDITINEIDFQHEIHVSHS